MVIVYRSISNYLTKPKSLLVLHKLTGIWTGYLKKHSLLNKPDIICSIADDP